jgi:PAS domain S-box-containing protein
LAALLDYASKDFPVRLPVWLELFHPEDRRRFEEALAAAEREPGGQQVVETRLRSRSGAYRWLRLGFLVDSSAGGAIAGTATDLTRLKLAEEKFRGLVEQSLAGIFILQENRVVYANPKFWAIVRSGGARPPLRPEFLELVHPEDRAMTADRLRPVYAGTAHEAALLFRLSGPQGASVAVQGHGIMSEHEGEPAILGLVMDVSHRFAQEQTSRRMSQVVEQSPVAILITDPQGIIEYANRKFCEVSGYPQEELLGQMPYLLRPNATPIEFYTDLWARLREGKKWEGEHYVRDFRRKRFGHPLRQNHGGHHQPAYPGRAPGARPAAGKHRQSGRRHRPRLEQHPRAGAPGCGVHENAAFCRQGAGNYRSDGNLHSPGHGAGAASAGLLPRTAQQARAAVAGVRGQRA